MSTKYKNFYLRKDNKSRMKIKRIHMRRFRLSDLKYVIKIEKASFKIDAYTEDIFKKWYHKCPNLFIVAEMSGVIVGYMITSKKGEIVSIAVDSKYRHRGIGKALAKFTFNLLKKYRIKSVQIEVRTTNKIGIKFWKSLGFFIVGTIPKYYEDGADALKMKRFLE